MTEIGRRSRLLAAIFDVDGVLVASPHERAWRVFLGRDKAEVARSARSPR